MSHFHGGGGHGGGHGGGGWGRRGYGGYGGGYGLYGYGLPVVYDYRDDPLEDGLFGPIGGEDGEACFNGFLHDDYMTYLGSEFGGDLDIHDDGNLLTIRHKHR